MKSRLKGEAIVQLAEFLELGLRAGKDWTQVFSWLHENHSDAELRSFCGVLLSRYKVQTSSEIFSEFQLRSKDPLERLFFQIIQQGSRSSSQLSESLAIFIRTAKRVSKLQRQQRSLMFLPKFQSLVALTIVFIFIAVLPAISPGMFPSFLTLGRWELFLIGLSGIGLGFSILWMMSSRPQRRLNELLSFQFFFFFMATYVRGGVDLPTAWVESLKNIHSKYLEAIFMPKDGLKVTRFRDFIVERIPLSPQELGRHILGLLWVMPTGFGLSDYLQASAESESERLFFEWEDELRKLGVTTVLPLSLLIFPSALFLLAGPQILGAFSL